MNKHTHVPLKASATQSDHFLISFLISERTHLTNRVPPENVTQRTRGKILRFRIHAVRSFRTKEQTFTRQNGKACAHATRRREIWFLFRAADEMRRDVEWYLTMWDISPSVSNWIGGSGFVFLPSYVGGVFRSLQPFGKCRLRENCI